AGFGAHQRPRLGVPAIAAIVVGVDEAGIEEDAHGRRRAGARRALGRAGAGRAGPRLRAGTDSPPKPVPASSSSARSAVSARPLANAPPPGGPSTGSLDRYASTAWRTNSAIGCLRRTASIFSRTS